MKKALPALLFLVLTVLLLGILTYSKTGDKAQQNIQEVRAVVLETDESDVIQAGISKIGNQQLIIKITEGKYAGDTIAAGNHLLGKLELDSFYKQGDEIVAAILEKDGEIKDAKALEIYRQDWELVLFGIFVLCLLVYAGVIGLKALFSFVASLYLIWAFLLPGLLDGKNPLVLASVTLVLLTAIIIFSVAGLTKKGVAAFCGTIFGFLITAGITLLLGSKLALNGMTLPYAESLLFSGHLNLNMRDIFYAAIIIGASGAAMDIAMDVAAAIEEIKAKKPEINVHELIQSGFNIGRAVIGTMTTTLLLAYSGGYLTLLMLFMTKNSSPARILNLKIVAAEIMRTLVGSIGLVLVAPLTAVIAGLIFSVNFQEVFVKHSAKQHAEKETNQVPEAK